MPPRNNEPVKTIEISNVEMELKRGGRKAGPEEYPFGKLEPATWTDETKKRLKGPSFIIPKEDHAKSVMAAGRKRHRNKRKFLSRKLDDGNTIVWRHPDDALPKKSNESVDKAKEKA